MPAIDYRTAFHCLLHDLANRVASLSTPLAVIAETEPLSPDGQEMFQAAVAATDLASDVVVNIRELDVHLDEASAGAPAAVPIRAVILDACAFAEGYTVDVLDEDRLDTLVSVDRRVAPVLGMLIRQAGVTSRDVRIGLIAEPPFVRIDLRSDPPGPSSQVLNYFAQCISSDDGGSAPLPLAGSGLRLRAVAEG